MRRAVVVLASIATCALADIAMAESWRIPDVYHNARPRYYDYRAPRRYYYDDAPVALRVPPPAFMYVAPPPPAPSYLPTGAYLHPPGYLPSAGYPPPAYGYEAPPPAVRARPICGVYRFWNGERCADARGY